MLSYWQYHSSWNDLVNSGWNGMAIPFKLDWSANPWLGLRNMPPGLGWSFRRRADRVKGAIENENMIIYQHFTFLNLKSLVAPCSLGLYMITIWSYLSLWGKN